MPLEKIQTLLAEKLGVTDASPEEQVAVIEELGGLALQRLTFLIYKQLSDADRTTFDELSDKRDMSGMQKFMTERVPNLEQLTGEAIATEIAAFQEFQKSLPEE